MVGDTCMDMKMGAAAGVRTVGVTWGNHCINRLTEGGAVHVVSEKFSDLGDVIRNWRKEFEAA
jgi:phosphoglycolate phosphatase